jgi:uncharacterized protein YdaU (DUF1376 family)
MRGAPMAKLPYMQFYPADYLLDTQPLSASARGVWMDMLCLMWRSETRGLLEYTPSDWTRVLRVTPKEMLRVVTELKTYGICDITTLERNGKEIVRVTSRRMLRDEKARQSNQLYVQRSRSKIACKVSVSKCKTENQNQSHISESESESEKKEEEKRALRVSTKRSAPQSDEEWLTALKGNEAYTGIDVPRELVKCRNWCEVNRKTFTRRRFINWLNHADRPMQATVPLGPMIKPQVIPPFPGPEDPIGRNSWRRAYGTLTQVR